jgi:hypothetical protein
LLRQLKNDDIQWSELWRQSPDQLDLIVADPVPGTAAAELDQLTVTAVLLRGLDGERKFVAAHVLLSRQFSPEQPQVNQYPNIILARLHRLIVEIRPGAMTRAVSGGDPMDSRLISHRGPPSVYVDKKQLDNVRDFWHVAYDHQIVTVSYFWLIFGQLLLPAFVGWRAVARFSRRKRGCCVTCGYDLRASAGRCPECGSQSSAEAGR